jgi:CheY-like chemotaxis protein
MSLTPTSPLAQDLPYEGTPLEPAGLVADMSRALVVGRSPITCVVVAKIAERVGLKTFTEQPDAAAGRLAELLPGLVIVDGGLENRDCEHLMPTLNGTRRAAQGMPVTILLSSANVAHDDTAFGGMIDAVVAKPITPENLQPVIERLLGIARA